MATTLIHAVYSVSFRSVIYNSYLAGFELQKICDELKPAHRFNLLGSFEFMQSPSHFPWYT